MAATVGGQARALLAKSAVYQRRNTATNVCLLVAPIFFCGLLAVLQLLANNLILEKRDNKCGCRCVECCVPRLVPVPLTMGELDAFAAANYTGRSRFRRVEDCAPMTSGYCTRTRNATCYAYDDNDCGLKYSSPEQAAFCPIPEPSTWPPVMQVPRRRWRAGGNTTTWLPVTGSDLQAASRLAVNMFLEPELPAPVSIIAALGPEPLEALRRLSPSELLGRVLPFASASGVGDDAASGDGAQLSELNLNFGSGIWPTTNYYLENAFINWNSQTGQLQFIAPRGSCAATGLGSASYPLTELLIRYYNATYPVFHSVLDRLGLNSAVNRLVTLAAASPLSAITAACVEARPIMADNTTHLHREIYCGWFGARCNGSAVIREFGAAWDFKRLGLNTLEYDVHYNVSLPKGFGPEMYRLPQLLHVAVRAWTRAYHSLSPSVALLRNRLLGVQSMPKAPSQLRLDFSVLLGPLFYTWVVQMLLPTFLQQLVYEKEKRLRMVMKMHGLSDVAYWAVTYLWFLLLYVVYMVFFVFFGSAIGLKIFTTNDYGIQAVTYFIFGNNMIAFIFLISSFFKSSRTATVAAFLYVFASGLIGELLLRALMESGWSYMLVVQLMPGWALYRSLWEFSQYSIRALLSGYRRGMAWSDLAQPGNGVVATWVILAAEWPAFMLLAWYLEQVLPTGTGARRHPLFFLQALRRTKGTKDPRSSAAASSTAADAEPLPLSTKGAEDSGPAPHTALVLACPSVGILVSGSEGGEEGGSAGATTSSSFTSTTSGSPQHPAASAALQSGTSGGGGAGEGCGSGGGNGTGAGRGPEPPLPVALRDSSFTTTSSVGQEERPRSAASRSASLASPVLGSAGSDTQGGSGSGSGSGVASVLSGVSSRSSCERSSRPGSCATQHSQHVSAEGVVLVLDGKLQGVRPAVAAAAAVLDKAQAGAADSSSCEQACSGLQGGQEDAGGKGEAKVQQAGAGSAEGASKQHLGGPTRPQAGQGTRKLSDWASARKAGGGDGPMGRRHPDDVAAEARGVEELMGRLAATGGAGPGGGGGAGDAAGGWPAQLPAIVVHKLTKVFAVTRGPSGPRGDGGGSSSVDTGDGKGSSKEEDSNISEGGGKGGIPAGAVGTRGSSNGSDGAAGARGGLLSRLRRSGGPRQRVAVRELSLAIQRGECFGLLGPNGAGKSTTLNMLTGFLEPTSGDALVAGCSVRERMHDIYRVMGVCPQDNLLWETLTGEEHLLFYGRLKGLRGKDLADAVEGSLRSVRLHVSGAGRRRVSSYSGGMKRRLSVAISFIGSPKVVYLDEPSTGLDPASRRGLWDVVRRNKEHCATILTTHSMEEAEQLCDRLGIFVDGQLVCIGNPREITSRYAGYLVFTITVGHGHDAAAEEFVKQLSPNSRLTYALNGTYKYELPTTDVSLSSVFDAMAHCKTQIEVLDWGVANATLEEVFIKFAKQIGAEIRE